MSDYKYRPFEEVLRVYFGSAGYPVRINNVDSISYELWGLSDGETYTVDIQLNGNTFKTFTSRKEAAGEKLDQFLMLLFEDI